MLLKKLFEYCFLNFGILFNFVQVAHRTVHKEECERLEQQMKRADVLYDFPFTFTQEATVQVIDKDFIFRVREGALELIYNSVVVW